ncbi:MAG: Mpo1-like protein [Synechococcaceae cyanobacterium]|nr:Mpo1-like protein [Synechococcaceae cyanobacterium]
MPAGLNWDERIAAYGRSHLHPFNQRCHLIGIPLILLSLPLAAAGAVAQRLLPAAALLFGLGWALQFLGHAVEGKPPEFLQDPRFLLVGVRWWLSKLQEWRHR